MYFSNQSIACLRSFRYSLICSSVNSFMFLLNYFLYTIYNFSNLTSFFKFCNSGLKKDYTKNLMLIKEKSKELSKKEREIEKIISSIQATSTFKQAFTHSSF